MNHILLTALDAVGVLSPTRIRVGDDTVEAARPRALIPALGAALYASLHVGKAYDATVRPTFRDLPLEAELAAVVPHRFTPVPAAVLDRGDECVVELSGVRVRVPADRIGDGIVSVDACRPALSPGFFLCDGSAGSISGAGPILRIYVHLAGAGHAPSALGIALRVLEQRRVRYRAKILSRRDSYPRRDSLVVYLEEPGWPALTELIAALSGLTGLVDATSVFARRVAPGVALAWDPVDDRVGMRGLSFGEHRARAVAEGVVEHAADGTALVDALVAALRRAGADPLSPYRNVTSPELPGEGLR